MWQSIINSVFNVVRDAVQPGSMLQAGKDLIMNNPELTVNAVSEVAQGAAKKAKEVLKG